MSLLCWLQKFVTNVIELITIFDYTLTLWNPPIQFQCFHTALAGCSQFKRTSLVKHHARDASGSSTLAC